MARDHARILNRMRRRLAAAAFVFVLVGAPAALTACELVCAIADAAPAGNSPSHSCHGTQPPEGPAFSAGVHACGHSSELPEAKTAASVTAAPGAAAAPVSARIAAPDALLAHEFVTSRPRPSRVPAPLRI